MKIIEKLSDMIADEIECAEKYAKCALYYKEEYPQIADTFYKIANEKMEHMNLLHADIVTIINDYRKEKGEPPAPMMAIYNYMHERHITKAAAIKNLQDMYTK